MVFTFKKLDIISNKYKNLIIIAIVYTLSQWFLLVATGNWWDDWLFIDKNWENLYYQQLISSVPLDAYLEKFLWLFPDGFYRYIVFTNYLVGALLIYNILGTIEDLSENDCFWIVILYTVAPINDARITWICTTYSIGLLSYWVAFSILTKWINMSGKRAFLVRIIIWCVLLFSFNTESIMLMTVIMLLYIVYKRKLEDWDKKVVDNIRDIVLLIIKHFDFIIIPILYYFVKHILFPADVAGMYYRHGYVDWWALPTLLLKSPIWTGIIFIAEYVYNAFLLVSKKNVIVIVALVVPMLFATLIYVFDIIRRHKFQLVNTGVDDEKMSLKKGIYLLLTSTAVYYIGLFPYYVRNHGYVSTREYNGRHSLLLGLGSAMLVYFLVKVIFPKGLRKLLYFYIIIFGIVFFNVKYLEWQEDYYQTLRFENAIVSNECISNNDTFYTIFLHPGINIEEYRLAGNAWEATGNWDKQFRLGEEVFCDPSLDGIVVVNNEPISYSVIINQKLNELFNKEKFNQWIIDTSDVSYIELSEEDILKISRGETSVEDYIAKD